MRDTEGAVEQGIGWFITSRHRKPGGVACGALSLSLRGKSGPTAPSVPRAFVTRRARHFLALCSGFLYLKNQGLWRNQELFDLLVDPSGIPSDSFSRKFIVDQDFDI